MNIKIQKKKKEKKKDFDPNQVTQILHICHGRTYREIKNKKKQSTLIQIR